VGDLVAAGLPVRGIDGTVDPASAAEFAVDLAAWTGDGDPWRRALAATEGPIRPLITEHLAPARYGHERAVCIDTAAAGGNATLLARTG
jgi:RHH-type proline utilization regulon transcriptional repressor/proline dehydrogenase/delta 1-pyrroline-5-carboxylate dehydrogenase